MVYGDLELSRHFEQLVRWTGFTKAEPHSN